MANNDEVELSLIIEDMKIDAVISRVVDFDKRNHIIMGLARKLASSIYTRRKNVKTFLTFTNELFNTVMPLYDINELPSNMIKTVDILKTMYNSDYGYVKLVAINSFNAILDQFTVNGNVFPNHKVFKNHVYRVILISMYLSNQSIPKTNDIHTMLCWIHACLRDKKDIDIRREVDRFIKYPLPISDGRIRESLIELYTKEFRGVEYTNMFKYTEVYKSIINNNTSDHSVPNDIIILAKEYRDLMERIRDRYRYYMDKSDSENIRIIDDYLYENRINIQGGKNEVKNFSN